MLRYAALACGVWVCLVLASGTAGAVKAYPHSVTFRQPDGSTFSGRVQGDERFNWIETRQGHVVVRDRTSGWYEYGVIRRVNGRWALCPSGQVVGKHNIEAQAFQPLTRRDLLPLAAAATRGNRRALQPIPCR